MNTEWSLLTHGDPIGAIQHFLQAVWAQADLDAMLAPMNVESVIPQPHIIADPQELAGLNPFKPVMSCNASRFLPGLIESREKERVAALLRPCELRALHAMQEHGAALQPGNGNGHGFQGLLTICVDCLGTFPVEDFQWRADRKGSPEGLARESLQFARLGGLNAYRYRTACQLCASPQAQGADLNLGVIGVPVRQYILVQTRNEAVAEELDLGRLLVTPAGQELVRRRNRQVARLVERNSNVRERILHGLGEMLPANLNALVHQFQECGQCQECLEACPICCVDKPRRAPDGELFKEDVARWLVSCAGCGMCEQACSQRKPLSAIFAYIRQQLEQMPGYTKPTVA